MSVVVSDTSPIRALQYLDLLGILEPLYESVAVPPAVAAELNVPTTRLPALDPANPRGARARA